MVDIILIILICSLLFIIIIFNIIALINYSKKWEIDIIDTGSNCTYKNPPLPESSQICNKIPCIVNKDSGIKFSLGIQPIIYTKICGEFCKLDQTSTTCLNSKDPSEKHFEECIKNFKTS